MTAEPKTQRVALVTGAGGRGGIGRAIAHRLADQGLAVALTDIERAPETLPPDEVAHGWRGIESVEAELRDKGAEVMTHPCDLTDPDAIASLVSAVAAWKGRLDVLVNNARALMGKDARSVTELDLQVWTTFLAVNTTAPFLMIQASAKKMIEGGRGGRIVTIGSDMSKRALRGTAAYAASKFGVYGLTQAAALDLAEHEISVNLVCPGPVRTNRFNFAEQARAEAEGRSLEEVREAGWDAKGEDIPMKRPALPEEVAGLVAFLVSEEAGYITGQGYNINGGMFSH